MIGTPTQILSRHDLPITEIDRLEERLYDHNSRSTGRSDGRGLAFIAVDFRGNQIGAIAGYTWAGTAEIKQLWVDEDQRGAGRGRMLLETAITEAAARGCESVWVMSHDFQAPGLYEKLGFCRVAELAGWPPGHSYIILRRLLWMPDD